MSGDLPHRVRRPWWVRGLNTVAAGLSALRLDPFPLHAERLVDKAVRATGLADFGGASYRDPLDLLVREVNEQPGVTPFARLFMRTHLVKRLSSRLQIEATMATAPSIGEQPIERPLFILGLPRSGTTLLHRLLAEDPAHRAPLTWEMDQPAPPPELDSSNDPRIRRVAKEIAMVDRIAPTFRAIHELGAELPEECIALFANDLTSSTFLVGMSLPRYKEWLVTRDLTETYHQHRRQLQILQANQPPRRWVLKAPFHLHGLRWLLRTYPDACIVQTHRDPLSVVPSAASLMMTMRDVFEDGVSPAALGAEMASDLSDWLRRAMEARARAEADGNSRARFLDVHYHDLVADPIGTVQQIYHAFGFDLADEATRRMRAFLDDNRQHKHGTHRYTLAQFGLAPDTTRALFASYCDRFGVTTEARPSPASQA